MISNSALSQRRGNLCWEIFEAILSSALKPRAQAKEHPSAFYAGLRLCGVDGSQFSVANTPQDFKKHPADVLVALYSRRWEQEGFYRELKVDMRSADLIQSHTPETAAQEVAALLIAYAVLVEQRLKVATMGEVEVVRISFLKVMETVSGLWRFLEAAEDMLTEKQVGKLVGRVLKQIADYALGKRRKRSCPRGLRQPVSSWPRITKNTYNHGGPEYQTLAIEAQLP